MKILLVLPVAEHLRITGSKTKVPPREMLRFSILPLTMVAALTPSEHEVSICDENVQELDFDCDVDVVGVPLHEQFSRAGRITDRCWAHYDFRHTVIEPKLMTSQQLQDGADWLYRQYYRLDRVIVRTAGALLRLGPVGAYLVWKLSRTYRYDNARERIIGCNPARKGRKLSRRELAKPSPEKLRAQGV